MWKPAGCSRRGLGRSKAMGERCNVRLETLSTVIIGTDTNSERLFVLTVLSARRVKRGDTTLSAGGRRRQIMSTLHGRMWFSTRP